MICVAQIECAVVGRGSVSRAHGGACVLRPQPHRGAGWSQSKASSHDPPLAAAALPMLSSPSFVVNSSFQPSSSMP